MTAITITILLMLIFSAFFSGMEIAFVSANKLRIEVDKNKGTAQGRIIAGFIKAPSRFIGTMLLGNNIALVVYGIAMAALLEPFIIYQLGFSSDFMVLLLQTIFSTLLILLFAEFLPKTLFRINPNTMLKVFAIPLYALYYLLYPVVIVFIGISEMLLRIFTGIRPNRNEYSFSVIDLDAYLREFTSDKEHENESNQEIQMFQNAIDFRNVKLRECMVPRTDIIALDISESIEALKESFIESGYSKILIYRDSIDNIIGYSHAYDMFKKPETIQSVLKPISIYPESMLASNVLNQFIRQHRSVAVVVDEFGGTSGMVTMEDIMEEIFGEIADEYDSEDHVEKMLDEHHYLFSGRMEIDYLNEKYRFELPEDEDYETLAGFLLKQSGSIPSANELITFRDMEFKIIQVTEKRIELVQVTLNE